MNTRRRLAVILSVCTTLVGSMVHAQNSTMAHKIPVEYRYAGIRGEVPYTLLYAVALQESNNPSDEVYRPWPWTLNVGGKPAYLNSEEEAVAMLKHELSTGKRNIDICAGQINYRWNKELIPSIDDAFKLSNCLEAATSVLVRELNYCKTKMGVMDWWCAVMRYHSPGDSDAQRARAEQYANKVMDIHERLVNAP